ncbi:MAG TPA: HAD-IIIC family phosphatase [Pyrinomonadaceae bacterium]|nr:HAD-IIIC family phosphatase [Pyrinomonadaceae bacterium]
MKLSEALKIIQSQPDPGAQKFSVYLACGIFPLHLTTFLAAHLSRRFPDRAVEIQSGLYGDLPGNLELLRNSSARAAAVVVEWADLDPRLGLRRLGGWGPNTLPDIQSGVQQTAGRLLKIIAAAGQKLPVAVSLPTIPLPPISYQPSEQSGLDNLQLEKTLADFALSAAELPQVRIVNAQRLAAVSPVSERLDVKSELSTGFPYRTAHASKLAELLAYLIHPRPPKKGLITDLDDTLWRGLVGEEGANGVSWELDRRSHIHALYQQLLRALSESGVLIGVASKNDPELVREALAREDLILPGDSLFPVDVNWGPKSQSIGRILEAWNISADAVVFVDDSALELAEVKSIHPEMECLRFSIDDEQSAYELLEKLRDLFGKPAILADDAIRVASVRSGSQFQRQVQTESARPLADFLKEVNAELTLSAVAQGDPRAIELVNKTNQFNLNGKRLDEGEFQAALSRPNAVSLMVSYNDKYGPLGKIAVLLGQHESSVLKIDTWVMSCRAFSRYIEHRCLEYLFESLDLAEIELEYSATARNGPVREFLSQFLDTETTGPFRIQRETFMNRKPSLAHKIKEVR